MPTPLTTADCLRFNIPFDDQDRWWWDDDGYLCEAIIGSPEAYKQFRHRNTGPQPKLIPMNETPPIEPSLEAWMPPEPQTLKERIKHAINCVSAENGSDTPDFILADYLLACLDAFDAAVTVRERWYRREQKEVEPPIA